MHDRPQQFRDDDDDASVWSELCPVGALFGHVEEYRVMNSQVVAGWLHGWSSVVLQTVRDAGAWRLLGHPIRKLSDGASTRDIGRPSVTRGIPGPGRGAGQPCTGGTPSCGVADDLTSAWPGLVRSRSARLVAARINRCRRCSTVTRDKRGRSLAGRLPSPTTRESRIHVHEYCDREPRATDIRTSFLLLS